MDIDLQDPNRPTNFCNPMYESFGDASNGTANGFSKDIPQYPSSPPLDAPSLLDNGAPLAEPHSQTNGGFSPSTIDTFGDTEALVEKD